MKRILAIILSIAILVMAFPLSVFATEPVVVTDTWDGTTTEPTATDADGNIIINNAEEFAWLALVGGDTTVDKTYKIADGIESFNMNGFVGITADSTATDVKNATTTGSEFEWNNDNAVFKGNFNGNGITIYNIASKKGVAYGALFPNMICDKNSSHTIENVTVKASAFYGYHFAAGLLGNTNGQFIANITKCAVENCYLAYYSSDGGGNKIAASIVGMSQNVTVNISNCLTIDNIIESAVSDYSLNIKGGFIGNASTWAPSAFNITNSISIGTSPYPTVVDSGTIGDDIVEAAWSNIYTDVSCDRTGVTTLTTDEMQGSAAKDNMALAWNIDWLAGEDGAYPSIYYGEPIKDPYVWDGTYDEPTETDAEGNIIINTVQEMAWIALKGGADTANKNYKVADDVEYFNMNGMSGIKLDSTVSQVEEAGDARVAANQYSADHNWRSFEDSNSCAFQGNFDGNGVTVYNIYSYMYANSGLFPCVDPSTQGTITIKNVMVTASYFSGYHYAGGVVGLANAQAGTGKNIIFENCAAKNTRIYDMNKGAGHQRTVGTIVGGLSHNGTTFDNCLAVNNKLTSTGVVGGFFGNTSNFGSNVTVNNSVSVGSNVVPTANEIELGSKVVNTTYTNVYTDQSTEQAGVTVVANEDMIGYKAYVNMKSLDESVWFFNTTTYPELYALHNVVDGECECGLVVAGDPCVNGHTLTSVAGYEATALSTGLKAHDKCSVCSKTFIDGVEVAASDLIIPSLADIWDGTFVEPTETDADGNIIINTAEELAWVALRGGAATQGKSYKVAKGSVFNLNGMEGITANSTVAEVKEVGSPKADAYSSQYAWRFESDDSSSTYAFAGNFDGNGLIVYNLFTSKGRGAAGLFPVIYPVSGGSVTIKNVTITASHIGAYHEAAGIVGYANAPDGSTSLLIENCAVKNCYIYDNNDTNPATSRTTATLVGHLLHTSTTVNNCLVVDNELSAQGIIGGLFGNSSNYGGANTVKNVISIGTTVQPLQVGVTINDKMNNTTYVNVYTDEVASADGITTLTTDEMKGAAAADNMNLNWNINWAIGAEGEYPSIITDNTFYDEWDGTFVVPTKTDAEGNIIISTAEEMAWVALRGDTATTGKNYKVADGIKYFNMNGMTGISLNSTVTDVKNATKDNSKSWTYASDDKIGTFYGNFDGNGVTIYNIYTKTGYGYGGLFPVIKPQSADSLTVKNVAVVASYIGGYHYAGGIIGYADAPDTSTKLLIENIIVKNSYMYDNNDQNPATQRTAGVVVGSLTHNSAVINNVFASGNELSANGILGGLFGNSSAYAAASTVSNVVLIGTGVEPVSVDVTVSEKVANTVYTNVYTDQPSSVEAVTTLAVDEMYGTKLTLDWAGWIATAELPKLRAFHNIVATDNGDGTHNESCTDCEIANSTVAHIFVNGVCICGAEDTTSVMYGDANGDGKVNGRDYAMILQYINGVNVTIDLNAADVTGDGKVNGRDYAKILQAINGWDVNLDPRG
ncbi:MAG: dockerin type I repeat-containing protein [Clostridia bacterium]|nr:dockerin type I repeat-containing protein [Clostridia bacterium]